MRYLTVFLLLTLLTTSCRKAHYAMLPPSRGTWLTPPVCRSPTPARLPVPTVVPIQSPVPQPLPQRPTSLATPPKVKHLPNVLGRVAGRQLRRLATRQQRHAPTSHAADGIGRLFVALLILVGLTILALVLTLAFPGTVVGIIGLVLLCLMGAVFVIPLLLVLAKN